MKFRDIIPNIFNFIKPLFCEDDKVSIGRVGLWVLLYKIWTIVEISADNQVSDVPENLLFLTIVFVAYNLSKKVDVFVKIINAFKGHNVAESN